jgi:hypothetical protein
MTNLERFSSALDRKPVDRLLTWDFVDNEALLYDPERRLNIGLSYPARAVPYLGIWLDEGGLAGQYNIAPEPATAAMDRLDLARMWGTSSVLEARGTLEWHLNITVESGGKAAGLTENGRLLRS